MVSVKSSFAGRHVVRRVALAALAGAAITGAAMSPAAAWWRSGVWIGGPVFVGPPPAVYPPAIYPPPVYYPPPPAPVWYTPPAATAAPLGGPSLTGQSCYAGPYVCPMDQPVPSGNACYCMSNGHSRIWGRASQATQSAAMVDDAVSPIAPAGAEQIVAAVETHHRLALRHRRA